MKTRHIYTSLILLILIFSGLFGITVSADAQKVHALLICLGDDLKIRASVKVNEEKMTALLRQASESCDVDLTIMKSVKVGRGVVTKMTFAKGNTIRASDQEQGLITTNQVVQWVEKLRPKAEDTVLVYYNGHGKAYGKTHMLHFDEVRQDLYNRNELKGMLAQKQARLKMLITDTCKNQVDTPPPNANTYAQVRAKNRRYTDHLFLQHEGMLDITASSTNQFALANDQLGGYFTAALIKSFSEEADTKRNGGIGNSDGFLSWQEVFAKCVWETQNLFSQSESDFDSALSKDLDEKEQTTQTPEQFSLPKRIGRGGGSVPPQAIREQDGAEMVLIPAGEFQMGSNDGDSDEKPVHTIYVDAFYMDKYEVTNAQFKKFVDANPDWQKDGIKDRFHNGYYLQHWDGNNYPSGKADHPVVFVSWYAAMAYSEWAGKRLPTEAEWEKAARGGLEGKAYPWGNTIDTNQANYKGGDTTPVGRYAPNGYGLHDMTGNVWEWCLDVYDRDFYLSSPRRNPINGGTIQSITDNYTKNKYSRVLRGGSWGGSATYVRCAQRNYNAPTLAFHALGFRCARAVTP